MSDPRFPEKNRDGQTEDILDIRIEDSEGSRRFDPNSLIMAIINQDVKLASPVGKSVISGEPGFRYRDNDVGLTLSKEELFRFIEKNLLPEEYFKLRDEYGMFFMIHDDFYDEETGEAVQPMHSRTP
jgi:hypothetical protein